MDQAMIAQADAFFAGRPRQWALFEALRRAAVAAWPDTALRVMKTCVSFDDPKSYLYVSFPPASLLGGRPKESILLSFGVRDPAPHPRYAQVVPISKSRYTVHLAVSQESEIDAELMEMLTASRAAFEKRPRS